MVQVFELVGRLWPFADDLSDVLQPILVAPGIAVPADVSIVGFDDIAIAALHRISLTTVAQPLDFQGRARGEPAA